MKILDTTGLTDIADIIKTYYAKLASPALTGTPTAPTAPAGTNTTQIATTAFVQTAVSGLVDSAPQTLDTLNELAAALGDDPNFATTIATQIGGKADSTHTHASSDVTLMTGYSKPNATSAIATTDTLNQAIGKLEKALDDVGNVTKIEVSFTSDDSRWSNAVNSDGFYELTLAYTTGTYAIAVLCLDNSTYQHTLTDITYNSSTMVIYSQDKFAGKVIMI